LQLLWRRHQQGASVSDIDAMAVLGQEEVEIWFDFARILQEQRIIHRTDTGTYVLSRNLETIDFYDFYSRLPWPLPAPQDLLRLHDDDHWVQVLKPALVSVNKFVEKELRIPLSTIIGNDGAGTA